jgi:hypothetical protein
LPKKLPKGDPDLQHAFNRLQRNLRIWTFVFIAMGLLFVAILKDQYPTASMIWFGSPLLLFPSIPLRTRDLGADLLTLAIGTATFTKGVSLGTAFSPTQRKGTARSAVVLGGFAFMLAILIACIL